MKTQISILTAAAVLTTSTAYSDNTFINIKNSNPESIVQALNTIKSPMGLVIATPGSQNIMIDDTTEKIELMKKYVKAIDMPAAQIMIEARIVEASDTFSRSLGVSWGLHTTSSSSGKTFPFINNSDTTFGGIVSVASPNNLGSMAGLASDIAFGTIGPDVKLSMRLSAAASAGTARLISSPKILVQSGKKAKVLQGKDVAYTASTSDKVETKFVEAGLSLEVLPVVRDNKILLIVTAKNDAIGAMLTGSTTPTIDRQQASTELTLKSGQTLVIGGISVARDTENNDGVPGLKDLPVFGHFFKSSEITKTRSEILILLTPRIIEEEK